ncbi:MAG TPA: exodeoxyribonuclease VII large subunit [Tepidisphaeraceae bacterium]
MSSFFEFREKLLARASEAPPSPAPTQAEKGGRGGATEKPLTVSQLTADIDRVLRSNLPPIVMVRGECSNCKPHRESGHFYFTLKDAKSCIDCVMFRDDFAMLRFDPGDGVELLATGRVQVYAQRGRYQLYVKKLEPLGQGALELAFQQLRGKLEAEGLFDPDRKKELPPYPMDIALVTSSATAALQDMLKVLGRFAWLRVKLHHVPVQGDGAAEKIARKIDDINRRGKSDVILLARGGGSLEDLWEFNEEVLARAMAVSTIPIITGIGHEVDVSIADLVADYHAHTPTEAAQVVTTHWRNAEDEVELLATRLRTAMRHSLVEFQHRLASVERHEAFRRPLDRIHRLEQIVDDQERALALTVTNRISLARRELRQLEERLERHRPAQLLARLSSRLNKLETRLAIRHPRNLIHLYDQRLSTRAERFRCAIMLHHQRLTLKLDAMGRQLNAVSPLAVLKRGYSVTMLKKDNTVLRSTSQLKGGEKLITRVANGQFESVAEDPRQPKLFE